MLKGKVYMKVTLEERREAEKRIKEYVQASAQGLNKKEEDDFRKLVIQNEEAAKKVFRVWSIQEKHIF